MMGRKKFAQSGYVGVMPIGAAGYGDGVALVLLKK
jgi:hypothetical protein